MITFQTPSRRTPTPPVDRAVWDAYGWPADEIPADVEEDIILSRLLALNGEWAG